MSSMRSSRSSSHDGPLAGEAEDQGLADAHHDIDGHHEEEAEVRLDGDEVPVRRPACLVVERADERAAVAARREDRRYDDDKASELRCLHRPR